MHIFHPGFEFGGFYSCPFHYLWSLLSFLMLVISAFLVFVVLLGLVVIDAVL